MALEEHLASINENTAEIQALFDYLHQLDVKIEKVCQRLDQMQLTKPAEKHLITSLTQLEKKMFLVLYTEGVPLSWEEISRKTSIPVSLVKDGLSVLVEKGIPLQRSLVNDHLFFTLDPEFKEQQAKENLVNLSLESFM